jgi:site-specific recombinase XerD
MKQKLEDFKFYLQKNNFKDITQLQYLHTITNYFNFLQENNLQESGANVKNFIKDRAYSSPQSQKSILSAFKCYYKSTQQNIFFELNNLLGEKE